MSNHYTVSVLPGWMQRGQLYALHEHIVAAGGSLRLVGGVVRDWVRAGLMEADAKGAASLAFLDAMPDDLDMATSLLPEQIMQLAEQMGLKAVPTGIEHGTVTVVLGDKTPLEITTLREDIACDGRHATVTFGTSYEQDALRRDFTLNALYLGFDGVLHDEVGGLDDARSGIVRFIGDAHTRINEDALRILRFYRFIAQVGAEAIDAVGQAACTAKADFIQSLSAERIQKELMKLLTQTQVMPALQAMEKAGIFAQLGMAHPCLKDAYLQETTDPLLRLRLLLAHSSSAETEQVSEGLKLSNKDKKRLMQLQPETLPALDDYQNNKTHQSFIRKYGAALYKQALLVRAAFEALPLDSATVLQYQRLADEFVIPQFPITPSDLLLVGFQQNSALGAALASLEMQWEESNYALTHEDLISRAKQLLAN